MKKLFSFFLFIMVAVIGIMPSAAMGHPGEWHEAYFEMGVNDDNFELLLLKVQWKEPTEETPGEVKVETVTRYTGHVIEEFNPLLIGMDTNNCGDFTVSIDIEGFETEFSISEDPGEQYGGGPTDSPEGDGWVGHGTHTFPDPYTGEEVTLELTT